MLARLVTSLNWTLGSLALILAFAGPQLLDAFLYPVNKTEAVKAAKQIAEGQNAYFRHIPTCLGLFGADFR